MKLTEFILIIISSAVVLVGILFLIIPSPKHQSVGSIVENSKLPTTSAKVLIRSYHPVVPTLTSIFTNDHDWVATLSAEHVRTMVATGDVSLARQVNIQILQKSNLAWPFEKTKTLLESADVTYVNLENPLIENCPLINTGFVFCGKSWNVDGLVFAGVDVVNFANNHASNYGIEGVTETVQLLEQNNLLVSGVHGPVYKTIDGVTFAFLGYNEVNIQPGVATSNESLIQKEAKEARANADIVVVQFHWGTEYVRQPTSHQKLLAHLAVDSGADVIVGNHPHWYQAVEMYNNKFIAYSHGNFVFDQMWSQETREGVVGKYTFYDRTLVDVEFIPILIQDYGQPAVIDDVVHKQKIIDVMKKESEKLTNL